MWDINVSGCVCIVGLCVVYILLFCVVVGIIIIFVELNNK